MNPKLLHMIRVDFQQSDDLKNRPWANPWVETYCSIVIANAIKICDIKMLRFNDGRILFVWPKKTGNHRYKNVVHPITSQARQALDQEILECWEIYKRTRARLKTQKALQCNQTS